jgi:hypothetical protein
MEEVVPGASVCPTLARLDITQAGYAAAALTVSVAVLLVTLPAVLLTTSVNCAQLSELVAGGVV